MRPGVAAAGFLQAVALIGLLSGGDVTASAAGPASDLDSLRDPSLAGPVGVTDGFVRALEPREFHFPADGGPHPEFRHEWWYVTGNLDSAAGERFGFELTFFRFGLTPPAAPAPAAAAGAVGSEWRARQIYFAHFAITDVARGTFRFAQKYSRDALGLAGAQAAPFRVWLDDWTLDGTGRVPVTSDAAVSAGATLSPPAPAPAPASGWLLHAAGQGYELNLDARPLMAPVANGDRGLSRKSGEPGAASFYYSIPRVAVRGQVLRAGQPVDVTGVAWLDREWGSGSLGESEQGWDWFAFQQQDGSTLMFYSLRTREGGRDSHSAGTWVDAAGRARGLSSDDVHIDVSDYWVSPRGGRYPSRWHVSIPSVGLDVEARPALADQELGTRPRYWEGAVDVRGTQQGRNSVGRGYVELVGYGE